MNNVDKLNKALQLREAGYVDRAAGIIKTLRERSTHPRDAVSLAVMEAGCYREMENFGQAKTLLSQARAVATNDDLVNLSIEHETARLERAQGLKAQALRRTSRILQHFRDLLAAQENSPFASQLTAERAMLMAENGLYKEAIPLLTQCHAAQPERSEVLYYLGDASFRTNKFEEAIKYLSEASQRPDLDVRLRPLAQYLLAYAYYRLGIYAQAVKTLQRLENNGYGQLVASRSVYEMLADSYHRLGMESESTNYREKAKRSS